MTKCNSSRLFQQEKPSSEPGQTGDSRGWNGERLELPTNTHERSTELRLNPSQPFLPLRRGFSPSVTPVPIPNTAVKTWRADDTAPHRSGKVGRCDVKSPPGHLN